MGIFEKQVDIWLKRQRRMGDGAVGRQGEDVHKQGARIMKLLDKWLPRDRRYEHGLDLGCGWGRFSGFLAARCGHLWAIDVLQDWVDRAAVDINITPVCLTEAKLPMSDSSMELIVDLQTLQSLDSALLLAYSKELSRVAAPGATVISLHLSKPEPLRSPESRAKLLKLKNGYQLIETDVIDKAMEIYTVLIGVRA